MKALAFALFLAIGCVTGRTELPSLYPGDSGVPISGDITDDTATRAVDAIRAKSASGDVITVEIDSNGGDAHAGLEIYWALRHAAVPSVCLVNGHAASAAFLILQGCTSRRMTKGSLLATHRPYAALPASTILTPEIARAIADRLGGLAGTWDALIAERLGMKLAEYQKRVANGEAWIMDSDTAIEANAVDVVVDGAPMPDLGPQ